MNKEFLPYEQALELKKLGFDEPCLAYWFNETPSNPEGQCIVYYKKPWNNEKIIKGAIREYSNAPTFSQAFRWFREKYGLYSFIFCYDEVFGYETYKEGVTQTNESFETYEEAELACLNKLIEIVKNK